MLLYHPFCRLNAVVYVLRREERIGSCKCENSADAYFFMRYKLHFPVGERECVVAESKLHGSSFFLSDLSQVVDRFIDEK
jgi:hypothetical protein